ncbi:Zinc finger BED domain-containing protein 5 [Eumeta japonica]|uniref:Zinc finger BED domain-containing protein 5 n=1 Tax=Eumeta variegata TaxID=151549 RepID=A0A4C1XZP0_EUMVA|nr:Zinc finger BED domain-containing protein 5 [Eumeta japonica]
MTLNVQKQYARRIQHLPTDPDDDATTSSSMVSKTKKMNSMAPAKLHRHLETVHLESKNKKEFFVLKKEQLLESQKNMMHVTQTINEKATEASYLVSYRIAQADGFKAMTGKTAGAVSRIKIKRLIVVPAIVFCIDKHFDEANAVKSKISYG